MFLSDVYCCCFTSFASLILQVVSTLTTCSSAGGRTVLWRATGRANWPMSCSPENSLNDSEVPETLVHMNTRGSRQTPQTGHHSWAECPGPRALTLVSPSGSGVSSFCLHPGVIRTELGRHVQGWFPLLGVLLSLPSLLLMKTPTQGSQTTVYCAVTPGLEERSGGYFR